MMMYIVKPIVCDYAVYPAGSNEVVCICNCKTNADLIADILDADQSEDIAHDYIGYSTAK